VHIERSLAPSEADDHNDAKILGLLVDPDNQRPWSTDELIREVGDRIVVTDSLARLTAAGLIHRCREFVCATRAAVRAAALGR
jgi:predicted transcriptional regulator